jgi:hypothetical protein
MKPNKYLEKIAKEYLVETELENPDPWHKIGAGFVGATTAGVMDRLVGKKLMNFLPTPANWKPAESGETLDKALYTVADQVEARGHNVSMDPFTAVNHPYAIPAHQYAVKTLHGKRSIEPSFTHARFANLATSASNTGLHVLDKVVEPITTRLGYPGIAKQMFPDGYKGELGKADKVTAHYFNMGSGNHDLRFQELGRIQDLTGKFGKAKRIANIAGHLTSGIPAAAIGGAMLGSEKTRDYAWAAPLALALPRVREEVAATKNGLDLIRASGGSGKGFVGKASYRSLKNLVPTLFASGTLAGVNYLKRQGEKVDPDEWLRDRNEGGPGGRGDKK